MFNAPRTERGTILNDALAALGGLRERDVAREHVTRARGIKGMRPHHIAALTSLVDANEWRDRRPERLHASVQLLEAVRLLDGLTYPDRVGGCRVPDLWQLRCEPRGLSYATTLVAEMARRAVVVTNAIAHLGLDATMPDFTRERDAHVEAVCLCRIDGTPVLEAVSWGGGPSLGAVVNAALLDALIERLQSKKKDNFTAITFA